MQSAYTVLILLTLVSLSKLVGRMIPLPLPLVQIAAGALLASLGPLHTAGYWPAGIMLAVGLYLIVRR